MSEKMKYITESSCCLKPTKQVVVRIEFPIILLLIRSHASYEGMSGSRGIATPILSSALHEGDWSTSRSSSKNLTVRIKKNYGWA
jgi:hypothetical protein